MSDSGITPINSGPLLIRTYLNGSTNDSYLLTTYDRPILDQMILITSTNGLVIPSYSITISSMAVSSLFGSTVTISSMTAIIINNSTLFTNTIVQTSTIFSRIQASSIITSMSYISSLSVGNTVSTLNGTFQTAIGSTLNIDQLTTNVKILGNTDATLDNVSFNNLISANITVNTISSLYLSSNVISTASYTFEIFSSNHLITPSFSTSLLSSIDTFISNNTTNTAIYNSTVYCSTLRATNFSYNTFLATGNYDTFNTYIVYGSSILCSTLYCTNLFNSTITISTLYSNQLQFSTGTYSSINGTSLSLSTLTTSTLFISSLYGSTLIFSTAIGSTIIGSTCMISTVYASQFIASTLTMSSLSGSTEIISSLTTSILSVSTLIGSTLAITQSNPSTFITSSLIGSTLNYSTAIGSSIVLPQLFVIFGSFSTLNGSTLFTSSATTSTCFFSNMFADKYTISSSYMSTSNLSTVFVSTNIFANLTATTLLCSSITASTIGVSTLFASSLQYSTLIINTANVSTLTISTLNNTHITAINSITNTGIGYQSLVNTTGNNNTAFGYNSLLTNTSGSYNTAAGIQALYYNTTGSYNTAIGYNAGGSSGFVGNNNLYVGFNAYPSNVSATNEIVIGGSNGASYFNNGNGSNTVTLGNSAIASTVLFGNVGINTTLPSTTLDIRGSSQFVNGNVNVFYSIPSGSSGLTLYSDNPFVGVSLLINGGTQNTNGGPSAATLKNNYGALRLQAIGGGTTSGIIINGNVGIGSSQPNVSLDIGGNSRLSGTLYTNILNFNGTLQYNGTPIAYTSQWNGVNPIYYTSGNVGIQTTTPNSKLDVYGKVYFSGSLTTSTITCGSLISGSINANSLNCTSINTLGNSIGCTSLNANTVTCNNLITNTINGRNIYTSLPTNPTFTGNLGITMTSIYREEGVDFATNNPIGFRMYTSNQSFNPVNKQTTGNFTISLANTTATLSVNSNAWAISSDERLKCNILPLDSSLSNILRLNPVTYITKNDPTKQVQYGFIAQEVQNIFPLIISELNNKRYNESNFLSMAYTSILPYLIRAFQEQHLIVQQNGTQLSTISSQLNERRNQIDNLTQHISTLHTTIHSHAIRITALQAVRDRLHSKYGLL